MATLQAQTRWRARNRYTKKQLNVMARVETHRALEEIARMRCLKGKGEAVSFCCFVVRWLDQQKEHSPMIEGVLKTLERVYSETRDMHVP